jgi:cytochrome c heme-lyase
MSSCPYKPQAGAPAQPQQSPLPPVSSNDTHTSGGGASQQSPASRLPAASSSSPSPAACPVQPNARRQKVYDVYSQEIDPTNNMPANPNQLPREDQSAPLSTDRVRSTIPKGGTEDDTWTYPSPQMFYNALMRKGKGDDVREQDMQNVVAVHNSMNEQTWNQILKWEAVRTAAQPVASPSLLRFLGRPDDISPKAWLLSTFTSKPKPFDRHDWTVLRGDEEVRYVIDYYYMDDGVGGNTTLPTTATGAFDKGAADGRLIYVDARPALDSWTGLVARVKVVLGMASISDPWVDEGIPRASSEGGGRGGGATPAEVAQVERAPAPAAAAAAVHTPKPLSHSLDVDAASREERFRPEALNKMQEWVSQRCGGVYAAMQKACHQHQQQQQEAGGEEGVAVVSEECTMASVAMQVCTAQVICESKATEFLALYERNASEDDLNASYQRMSLCVDEFTERAAAAAAGMRPPEA